MRPSGPVAASLYRLLLLVLPRRFRARFGGAMVEDFGALLAAHRRRDRRLGAIRAWRVALADLAATAVRERRGAWTRRPRGSATLLDGLTLDVRHAVRGLARSPGFALAALLTLALGIGAATAIFSVVRGVLLTPLPFDEPDRLVMITRDGDVSIPDGVDWRAQSETLADAALFLRGWDFDLTGEGPPRKLIGQVVEPRLFGLLGAKAVAGRLLLPEDDVADGPRVAVISRRLWRQLGGGADVLGRELRLSDRPTTVVGVAPDAADLFGDGVDLWLPVAVETPWALAERGTNNFDAVGRLAAGATVDAAQAELRLISEQLAERYPATNRGKIVVPIGLLDFLTGRVRQALWMLLAAVGVLLALASANLSGLLIARSAAREEEFAMRTALGAGRLRLVRQLVTEGLCLALAGGALGALVARWMHAALVEMAPESLPRIDAAVLDTRVFAFAFLVTVACGLAFSLVPALLVARSDPAGHLTGGRGTGASRGRARLRAVLVTAEVALAAVLLVGSALLVRTVLELGRTDVGFEPERLLTAALTLPEARYADPERQTEVFYRIVEQLEARPEVESAASVIGLPLETWGRVGHRLLFADRPPVEPGQEPGARSRPVAGDYFRTLGIPILAGRGFEAADHRTGGERVAVVNRTAADLFWPGRSPLGERLAFSYGGTEPLWMTVVGVCGDTRSASLVEGDAPAVYSPYAQRIVEWQRFGSLAVRTRVEPRAALAAVESAVWAVDPALPLSRVATMPERLGAAVAQDRFNALILTFFAVMATVMAIQGLYATLAYAVEQGRREIGVRVALGAGRGRVLALVLRRGLAPALAGLALGLPAAAALGDGLAGLLHGVGTLDPASFAAAAAVLFVTAVIACLVPAARAARLDPAVALRQD